MVDPVFALLVFLVLGTVAILIFWPRVGLAARIVHGERITERVLLEDALKHVFTYEGIGRICSVESLAGQLGVSTGKAATLLSRLAESKLISSEELGPRLTSAGRESALRLVRAHRLCERYLADRTGVPAGEWHIRAEQMEHTLSEEDADALASRLGHPAWDPHGDPIPTPRGDLPEIDRLTLAGVEPGRTVEIMHLEDEPREIYDALLADGLGLGTRLDVVSRSEQIVQLHAGGRDWSMSGVVARNVSVRVLPEGACADAPLQTLRDLSPGDLGRVIGISPACQGSQRRRLLDLGVVRGTAIEAELVSAGGDPVGYRIRGALIALRGEQAAWVRIERVEASVKASGS